MSRSFREDFDELRMLLDALCEESITAEQVRRLEELVLAHPEAEAYYVQYLSLYAELGRHFATLPQTTEQSLRERLGAARAETEPRAVTGSGAVAGSPDPATARDRRSLEQAGDLRSAQVARSGDRATARAAREQRATRLPRVLRWGALALPGLAAALALALALGRWPGGTSTTLPAVERTDNTVAVLLQAPGAEWEETGLPPRPGAPLPAGRLRLKSGLAHIEFYNGATVILEGPAELLLISRTEAYCAHGKLRATVPPTAHGFTIATPQWNLVDRGTEFGLNVGTDDKTEVHVFQGKVELNSPDAQPAAPPKELTTGQGVRLEGAGTRSIASNPAAFVTALQLEERTRQETNRRHQDWLAAGEAVRKDPSLLVYYPFQPGPTWSRTLPDQAPGGRPPHDGAIVGCAWVTGRWPGKQGLEFKRVSDRVRLNVPGEFDSVTLAAWVRVDALANLNNALFLTDGWDPGEFHWQIGEAGKLVLGVRGEPGTPHGQYHAFGAFTPERLGQWVHLAVVYDRDAGQVTHYVDGRPAARVPIEFDIPLRIGDAEIGNWNSDSIKNDNPVRYLSGCMDEFMLFARALADAEIERLSDQGRPPQ